MRCAGYKNIMACDKMIKVTYDLLKSKTNKFYPKQKWIEFCEILLQEGYKLKLYEAKTTRSKYILINDCYKVRFSNHKPAFTQQMKNDSDFYVGVHNKGVTTTQDALKAVRKRFKYEL